MNRYYINNPTNYGNGLQTHDLFIPPIRRNENCCFSHSRDESLFPCVDSREEERNPLSMNDGVDLLKLLGGVKDTAAACFRPAGSLACRDRSLRRIITEDSWTIQVLNQKRCTGDSLRFKLFPDGSQACMVLQGEEIIKSVEVLAADDGTQKGILFHVHMMHADHIETMKRDEVLEFLLRVLQCMDGGEVGKRDVPIKAYHLRQKQASSLLDKSDDSVSTIAYQSCKRIRFPRVHRLFHQRKF
jgi:hypothetical protein